MTNSRTIQGIWWATLAACIFVLAILAPNLASAQQTYHVIYTFTGGSDEANPIAGLSMDARRNLYGTTYAYGTGFGTVYQLVHNPSGWRYNLLYHFSGRDGAYPEARVLFGPGGALYGTTAGGGANNLGTVFKLQPSPTFCRAVLCPWIETVLYSFMGDPDGNGPSGELAFDHAGNIYGTTYTGGSHQALLGGTVFELTPSGSSWTESVLYSFDGDSPYGGVTLQAGNLYGTTFYGGTHGNGAVFQLTPSGSGWAENTLYSFPGEYSGGEPESAVTFDGAGNMYGSNSGIERGFHFPGTAWELMPSGGSWTFSTLYNFDALGGCGGGGTGPVNVPLTMDQSGNLYGTTAGDGANCAGTVFKLSPAGGGQWTYTSLHDFTGGSDGGYPQSNVIIDANGNLYGTASAGGNLADCFGQGCGVVWEITP